MYVKIASTSVCTNIAWAFEFMAICLFLSFLCNKINQDWCFAHFKKRLNDDEKMLDLKWKIN